MLKKKKRFPCSFTLKKFISFPAAEKVMWRIVTGSPFLTWEPAWADTTGTVHHGADSACLPPPPGDVCKSGHTLAHPGGWGYLHRVARGQGCCPHHAWDRPASYYYLIIWPKMSVMPRVRNPALGLLLDWAMASPLNSHLTSDTDFITVPGFQC